MAKSKIKSIKKEISTQELAELVVKGMQERKAHEIVLLDLRKVKNAIADYFVICSGTSDTQISAIGDSVGDEVFKITNTHPWHQEGKQNGEWVLLDYIDVVAHIFKKDRREFYKIEELWGDAQFTYFEE